MTYIIKALKAIAGAIGWLVPSAVLEKIKGWRTMILNFFAILVGILAGFDIIPLGTAICDILNGLHIACSPADIAAAWGVFIAFLNMVVRTITDTPIGVNVDKKK